MKYRILRIYENQSYPCCFYNRRQLLCDFEVKEKTRLVKETITLEVGKMYEKA